jgi:hypothetical protein
MRRVWFRARGTGDDAVSLLFAEIGVNKRKWGYYANQQIAILRPQAWSTTNMPVDPQTP